VPDFHVDAKISRSVANCGHGQQKINLGRITIARAKDTVVTRAGQIHIDNETS
jgi:hypothetical protein